LFYPAIELAALATALWAAGIMSGWLLWATCTLGWALLVLAVSDARRFILPDVVTLPLVPAGLIVNEILHPGSLLAYGLAALGGFLAFAGTRLLYRHFRHREGMGLGDAKLLGAAGAWVSWEGLPSVVAIASLAGLAAVLLRGGVDRAAKPGDPVPFGTFLCLGTWLVWLYGPLLAP
jgi:leader peptidase (prepilin peptidase) / N-methyltransferase